MEVFTEAAFASEDAAAEVGAAVEADAEAAVCVEPQPASRQTVIAIVRNSASGFFIFISSYF